MTHANLRGRRGHGFRLAMLGFDPAVKPPKSRCRFCRRPRRKRKIVLARILSLPTRASLSDLAAA